MTPLGLGSDLGGSIRAPATSAALFGLKPGRDTRPGPITTPWSAARARA